MVSACRKDKKRHVMDHYGSIGLSEEQAELLDLAEKFCRERSPIDKVRALIEDEAGYDAGLWKEIAELGWTAIAIPEAYGGVGLSLAEVAPVVEQMGRRLLTSPLLSTILSAEAILKCGDEAQKGEILPEIAKGAIATLALSETNNDWNLSNIEARASVKDGGFVLSGVKTLVADAAAARWIIVSALLEESPALFVIDASSLPDGALRRETVIDETKRSYELRLDDIAVPAAAMLDPTKAEATLAHIELAGDLLNSAEMVGGTQAVIDYTIEYLNTRKQFGKLIGSYQALKHPTVDAFVLYEQARSHLYAAAHSFNEQGVGEIATRMAKAQAEKAYAFAADRSIQFHGGFGFTYDCDAQLHRRRAIWGAAQYGDAAYQRNKLATLIL